MRQPERMTPYQIKLWNVSVEYEQTGIWIPHRQAEHNLYSFTHRWKLAFDVLTGKADALYWDRIIP